MINVENDIFNTMVTKLREKYPDIFVTGEYVKAPSSFPCVSIVEIDNSTLIETKSSNENEEYATVLYELNVYTNKSKGKKAECKEIVSLIDTMFTSLNFNRIMLQPIPNLQDATIYRMLGRYRAVVSDNNIIYRR